MIIGCSSCNKFRSIFCCLKIFSSFVYHSIGLLFRNLCFQYKFSPSTSNSQVSINKINHHYTLLLLQAYQWRFLLCTHRRYGPNYSSYPCRGYNPVSMYRTQYIFAIISEIIIDPLQPNSILPKLTWTHCMGGL
jgi:hypothetical protein